MMKFLNFYSEQLRLENENQVFEYLIRTLKPSLIVWNYFVNWDKVFKNTKEIEVSLNILNYLIGKDNFDYEFKKLITENKQIIKALPTLVVRDGNNRTNFKILVDYKNKKFVYEDFDFGIKDPTIHDIEKYLTFIKSTGIKDLLTKNKIKNLVDYMIGVEAGLDSNGRKNRSGDYMEEVVEHFINDICQNRKYVYLKEATAKTIKYIWGIDVPVDKSSRRYDFVIFTGKEIIIIETNYYGGTGSKLKSTAGEYRNLYDVLNNQFKFIWITDGKGWEATNLPLRETFNHNEFLINLSMLENNILNSIF